MRKILSSRGNNKMEERRGSKRFSRRRSWRVCVTEQFPFPRTSNRLFETSNLDNSPNMCKGDIVGI